MTEIEISLVALEVTALLLTVHYSRKSKLRWFLLKLIGVSASTVPIIGILQGGMFLEKDPPHSRACFIQAALAILAFLFLYYGLGVIEL